MVLRLEDLDGREEPRACGDRAADDCDRGARSLGVSELVLKQHNPVRPRPGFALFLPGAGVCVETTQAALDRRRGLVRAPLLPRAAEVDPPRRRAVEPGLLTGVGNLLVQLWEEEQPRAVLVGWDTLTVPTTATRRCRVTRAAASSTTRCWSSSTSRRSSSRQWALHRRRLLDTKRTTSSPRGRFRGGARRAGAGRERRPGHLPARQRVDDGSSAAARRRTADPDRPGRGARAVRRRAAQVPDFIALRGDPSDRIQGARRRREDRGRSAEPDRQPRAALAEGGVRRGGGRAALYLHCDHGPRRPAAAAAPRTGSRRGARPPRSWEWGLGRLAGRLEALSSS